MTIRKDDLVVVLTGEDADKTKPRKVLRVVAGGVKVIVEGVNRVYKHLKPNRRNQQGGRLSKEMPIDASNVLLWCNKCNKGVRLGRRFDATGKKELYCKKCSATMRVLNKAKKAHAKKA